jgi:hypothetical protein
MQNYFNYFTEVEEYFQQKRGTWMLLSTLDWALIDTWREAGIPLDVIFRGIDATFEKWEKRRVKTRRINGLAYCLQEVLTASEEFKEANVGGKSGGKRIEPEALFSREDLKKFFDSVAASIQQAASEMRAANAGLSGDQPREASPIPSIAHPSSLADDFERVRQAVLTLEEGTLTEIESEEIGFEQLERRLSAIEDKLLAAIKNAIDDRTLADLEMEADHALAPYKRNMRPEMISGLQKQFINKRLLERWSLPRISLFHLQ